MNFRLKASLYFNFVLYISSVTKNEFLFALLKKSLVGTYNMNEKKSKVKVTGRTFPESPNGKL